MFLHRNYLPSRGLFMLLFVLVLALGGCSQPLGEAGPAGIEPVVPVAPEAPAPEAEEQPNPNVVLTAEAGAEQDLLVGVGIVQSLEEDETFYTQSMMTGVQLAIDQINEADFLGSGRRLALMLGDTAIVDSEEVAEYEEPEFLDTVLATIGPVLRRGGLGADEDVAVPLSLRPDAGTEVFGEYEYVSDWTFRTGLASGQLTRQIVVAVRDQLGLSNVALLYTAAGEEANQVLISELAVEGIDVVATGSIDEGSSVPDLLLSIRQADPDAVVINLPVDVAAAVLTEAQAADFPTEIRFIAGAGVLNPRLLALAGDAATGLIGGVTWILVEPFQDTETFANGFREAYGTDPDPVATQAFTAIWMLAEAIRTADSADPAAVRDALQTIDGVETPFGAFAVDAAAEPLDTPVVLEVRDDGEISIFAP